MPAEHITSEQFKKRLEGGATKEEVKDLIVVKHFPATVTPVKAPDDGGLPDITIGISTGAVDRDNDTLSPNGWELDNYRKNPVVLWGHQKRLAPIGKSVAIYLEGDTLKSVDQFLTDDFGEHDHVKFSVMIHKMLINGFLSAASVGFLPKLYMHNEERGGWYPVDYIKQELLEHSIVPIPSNPEALAEATAKGIDLSPLKMWAEKELDSDGTTLCLPRSLVEDAYKAISTQTTTSGAPAKDPEHVEPEVPNDKAAMLAQTGAKEAKAPAVEAPKLDVDALKQAEVVAAKAFDDFVGQVADNVKALSEFVASSGRAMTDEQTAKILQASTEMSKMLGVDDATEAPEPTADPTPDSDEKNIFIELVEDKKEADSKEIDIEDINIGDLKTFIADTVNQQVMQSTGKLPN